MLHEQVQFREETVRSVCKAALYRRKSWWWWECIPVDVNVLHAQRGQVLGPAARLQYFHIGKDHFRVGESPVVLNWGAR